MMKARFKLCCLFVMLLLTASSIQAQRTTVYTIAGAVIDSATTKPVELATAILKANDGRIIRNAATDLKGNFAIFNIEQGQYTLTLRAVGYKPTEINVHINNLSLQTLNLKKIIIVQQGSRLKEVVVSARKALVRQEADRIVYDLQADPDSKANNLLDMMRRIPYLSVDGNENLLLKGQADYKVFINGKPSSMMERNLNTVLRSMPASIIQKIEVITNPSSKYDAEGLAGIINIITVKNAGNGYNGTLNLSDRYPVGGPALGGSWNARHNKIDVTAFGGSGIYNKPETESAISRNTPGFLNTALLQNGTNKSKALSGYFGSEISYSIDTLNLISGQMNINGNRTKESINQYSSSVTRALVDQSYNLYTNNITNSPGWDAGLNYQRGFTGSKNRLLTFSYRYLMYNTDLNSDVVFTERFNYLTPDYRQHNEGRLNEHTLQADYVHPLKRVTIESGIKGILRENSSAYEVLAGGASATPSNNYRNGQHIWAVYNTYQFKLSRWVLQAGFRIEFTDINADFITHEQKVKQHYLNLIPNVTAGKKINDYSSFNLGFSQRIKRPGINRLNPFVDRSNPSFEISGNPTLQPSLINNLQIGYSSNHKAAINLGVNYSWIKNMFLQVTSFNGKTQITRTTYQNIGKARALDGNFNINYTIGKAWNASINGHASVIWLNAMSNELIVENSWLIYNAALNTGYNFTRGWRLTANLNVVSRSIVNLQSTTNGIISSSLGVNKDLIKNKLSFAASVNNPFHKFRNNITETTGANFSQMLLTRDYFSQYNVSINYRFGKLKETVKKAKRSIKNDDLSN